MIVKIKIIINQKKEKHIVEDGELHLHGPKITSIEFIPKEKEKYQSLKYLIIRHTKISSIKGLEYLSNLKKLDLSSNQIMDLDFFTDFIPIKQLDLSGNPIFHITGLSKLQNLTKLVLNNANLTNMGGLDDIPNLKYLDLEDNKIQRIQGLENLTNLVKINLEKNEIQSFEGVSHLHNLDFLSLKKNKISKVDEEQLPPNLNKLRLNDNPVHTKKKLTHIMNEKGILLRKIARQEISNKEYREKMQNKDEEKFKSFKNFCYNQTNELLEQSIEKIHKAENLIDSKALPKIEKIKVNFNKNLQKTISNFLAERLVVLTHSKTDNPYGSIKLGVANMKVQYKTTVLNSAKKDVLIAQINEERANLLSKDPQSSNLKTIDEFKFLRELECQVGANLLFKNKKIR
jgi:Leucine Rich Repeat (LRR) protein